MLGDLELLLLTTAQTEGKLKGCKPATYIINPDRQDTNQFLQKKKNLF